MISIKKAISILVVFFLFGSILAQKNISIRGTDKENRKRGAFFLNLKKKSIHEHCPDKVRRKKNKSGCVAVKGGFLNKDYSDFNSSVIQKREHTISFGVLHLDEYSLDFPDLMHFENNELDLTPSGDLLFIEYVELIKSLLKDDSTGTGLTFYIKGGASQIPTSFDPSKEFSNLASDGSSKDGETSISNNLKLAHYRALSIAEKIKSHFPNIEIITPAESEIKLGDMAWTKEHQQLLREAREVNDTVAIHNLFEPFKKDQYVRIYSKASFIKTVQPRDVKMYAISTHPRFVQTTTAGLVPINGAVIVSQSTYVLLGDNLVFHSVEERNTFLKDKGLEIVRSRFGDIDRWFIVSNKHEKRALAIENEEKRIKALFELGIVHYQDKPIIESIITQDYLIKNNYQYKLITN